MVDTKFAHLSCYVGNNVGPIDLKFLYNLCIAKLYRMQKVASEYVQYFLRYRPKFVTDTPGRRKHFYCIFGIRDH
ncbi:hypothetical protein O3M35_011275 [Rhynocoris fuscipes]|uniref:Uncharacterized protein n=1 Tax=Rhynocoris fuscipes TaxID=488301 RepID=A0AAW1CWY0_9HEMI